MEQPRDVYLHGSLGRRFGRHFRLAVSTPAEAVWALCSQIKGLRDAIREGAFRVVAGPRGGRRDRAEDELVAGFSRALHIVPVVAGAGGKGFIIAGLTLMAAAVAFAVAGPMGSMGVFAAMGATTVFGVSTATIALVGVALTLQGVSMLLASKADTAAAASDASTSSFLFGGDPGRPVAGRPVPVSFGTTLVTAIPISVQFRVAAL
ncbi:MAG: tail assembly protein [Rhodoplanes sp.]|uniref:hypothetical protein n=1 Tax=Rhodoplanes sp. TaxID=1968906 RepID=UPI00183E8E6E|nr:hypothetical protein [Rhodoplanes sp.]NVO13912.1 tail assembly protein [Rhodoplanes sp.]